MAQLVKEAIDRVESQIDTQHGLLDGMANLIADLLHYCELNDIDFNEALELAEDFSIEDKSFDHTAIGD
jgi:hypothetical protein